jgi:hypothetical protein
MDGVLARAVLTIARPRSICWSSMRARLLTTTTTTTRFGGLGFVCA